MRRIIDFFIRFQNFLLFLTLFTYGIYLNQKSHSGLHTREINSSNKITGKFFSIKTGINDYLNLKTQNEILSEENCRLMSEIFKFNNSKFIDSVFTDTISLIRGHVINNNYNKLRNTFTIDKGREHGVKTDMGITSPNGIIGIVTHVSEHFSLAQSILNINSRIVVKGTKSNHFGYLAWDGKNKSVLHLKEIPVMAKLKIGDSIVTDGKSTIFPKDWPVGFVSEVKPSNDNDYLNVKVQPFTDMTNIRHVYLIQRPFKDEIKELEKHALDEL